MSSTKSISVDSPFVRPKNQSNDKAAIINYERGLERRGVLVFLLVICEPCLISKTLVLITF